ncbi:phosphotransferase [Nocardioides dilutus]
MYADFALRLPSTSARWASPAFRAELAGWVGSAVGEPLVLEPVRDRSWSTVWRVQAPSGTFFAKQNTPLQAFEARLLVLLGELAPAYVVPVAAADGARDLLLTPDQGTVLGEGLAERGEEHLVPTVGRMLVAAAQLQRALAPHATRLAEAGVERLAPSDAVPYVQQRLADFGSLPAGDPRCFEAGRAEALEAALPSVTAAADQVAALGLPLTLNHNDLHTYNVFDVDGQLRFFDFGDALLCEPLGALMVPLGGVAQHLSLPVGHPRVLAIAEPALEVWSDLAPLAELRAALPAALRLARLARAESWLRCFAGMTDDELAEWGDAAAYWLAGVADG